MDSFPVKIVTGLLLGFWLAFTTAHPKTTNVIPKEYFQRQMLPDIPGYIPVYIQHGDEPPAAWKSSGLNKQKVKSKPNPIKFKGNQVHSIELEKPGSGQNLKLQQHRKDVNVGGGQQVEHLKSKLIAFPQSKRSKRLAELTRK